MNTVKSLCCSLLALNTILPAATADQLRTDINPALLYYRALLLATDPISDPNRTYLDSKKGREQPLPERFGKIVTSSDHQFLLLRQAAHCTVPCDWGIDLSPGPNVHMPHLGRAKVLCRTAQLRALWALQHGRQEEARHDLVAAFALGRNVASDGLLISAFVQYAIEDLNYQTVAEYFGQFSPETLKSIMDGFESAPGRGTMASCMASEKMLGDWFLRKILDLQEAHPNDDAGAMAEFRKSGLVEAMDTMGYTNFWPQLLAASGGTTKGVIRLLNEAEPLFPRLAEIMAMPQREYETHANEFLAEIHKSGNPFFAEFAFVLEKWQNAGFRAREFKAQAGLAMVHAAIEYRLHGEAALKTVTDPFGDGPFKYQRFVFKGLDRGFQLKSAYSGADAPFVMIFVEKKGPPFQIAGTDAGKAIQ